MRLMLIVTAVIASVTALSGCADLQATYINPATGQKYQCEAYGSGYNAIVSYSKQAECEKRAKAAGFTEAAPDNNDWSGSWRAQGSWTAKTKEGVMDDNSRQ